MLSRTFLPGILALLLSLLAPGLRAAGPGSLHLLLDGDNRGRIGGDSALGARSLSVKRRLGREHPGLLLFSSGSVLGPAPTSEIDGGGTQVELMNRAGFQAMALGRKDFFLGETNAWRQLARAAFPVLLSNAREGTPEHFDGLGLRDHLWIEHEGWKLLVLGVLAPASMSHEPFRDFRQHLLPPLEALPRYAEQASRADLTLVLANSDFGETARVLEEIPWIDLVFANLTPGDQAVRSSSLEHVLRDGRKIVWAPVGGDALAHVEVLPGTRRRMLVELHELGNRVRPDPEGLRLVQKLEGRGRKALDRPLSELSEEEVAHFPRWVAEALRIELGAEVGLVPRGSCDGPLPPPRLTYGDVLAAFPYPDRGVVLELSGSELERLYRSRESDSDEERHLVMAGIEERRGVLLVNGRRFSRSDTYRVAMEGFVALGGWGYLEEPLGELPRSPRIVELVSRFFQREVDRTRLLIQHARRPIHRRHASFDFSASKFRYGGSADQVQFDDPGRYGAVSPVPELTGLPSSEVRYDLGLGWTLDRPRWDLVTRLDISYSRYNNFKWRDRLSALIRREAKHPTRNRPQPYQALSLRGTFTRPGVPGLGHPRWTELEQGLLWRTPAEGKLLLSAAYLKREGTPGSPESLGLDLGYELERKVRHDLELELRADAFYALDSSEVRTVDLHLELRVPVRGNLSVVARRDHFRFRDQRLGDWARREDSFFGLGFSRKIRRF